jgi:branched-chain amino acid transport system ATP-binding protein
MRRCADGIGRTFQIPQPFGKLTVFENLLVAATFGSGRSETEAAGRCADILIETGLAGRANAPAGRLTLLERKRLELARALATDPRLLLLDEIAGGLTEAEAEELVATVLSLKESGVTILWIEHVVKALVQVVDRLVCLAYGRIRVDGDPHEVLASDEVAEVYLGGTAA